MRDSEAHSEHEVGAPVALYHGACPVCGVEVSHYQSYCTRENVALGWEDISSGTAAPVLDSLGIDREDAKRRMTVIASDGTVHRGVDAFIVLWGAMPRYRLLSRIMTVPGIYHLGALVYDYVLAPALYTWNRRSGR